MNWLVAAFACLGGAVALHAVVRRIRPDTNIVTVFCAAGSLAGIALIRQVGSRQGFFSPPWLAAVALYLFACELYVFLFTFVLGSVSVWILVSRLYPEPLPAINRADDHTTMVNLRLERMVKAGLLIDDAPLLRLSSSGRLLLRVYVLARRFFDHLPEEITASKLK